MNYIGLFKRAKELKKGLKSSSSSGKHKSDDVMVNYLLLIMAMKVK